MAIDVTATDNYTALDSGDQTTVDTAITAIKAAFAAVDSDQKDNVYMIFKEQIESQEES